MRSLTLLLVLVSGSAAYADVLHMSSGQTGLDLVSVGDANNPADPTTGYGTVGYAYQIGKYEVTNAQYCQFLNAVLPTISDPDTGTLLPSDQFGLYNCKMKTQNYGGINYDPTGATGAKFSVKTGYDTFPVNYVSWYDTIRFANWLQNGQGSGNTESGTYTITGGGQNSGTVSIPDAATRAAWNSPHWVLPSEDEWYKAAYYQPAIQGGDADSYWLYPTGTNAVPIAEPPPGGINSANFQSAVPSPYLTCVGAYVACDSFYGTYDQGGNVWEWTEALIGSSRGVRGGSGYLNSESNLRASSRYGKSATEGGEGNSTGFRVAFVPAAVPEPSTLALLAIGAIGLLACAWRRFRE